MLRGGGVLRGEGGGGWGEGGGVEAGDETPLL